MEIKKDRVLMISLNLPPDYGGMRGWNIAKALVSQGYDVCAVTNFPNQPYGKIPREYRLKLISFEEIDRVKVIRVPTLPLPYSGVLSRLLTFSFFSLSVMLSLPFIGAVDFVYSRGPHPFTDLPAFLIKSVKHSSLILDVTDAWPESLLLVKANKLLLKLLFWIGKITNRIMYALSDSVITHTESLKSIISKYTDKKIAVIQGFVDTESFHPMSKNEAYRRLCDTQISSLAKDRFVLLYTGTIGPFRNLETIIDVAEKTEPFGDTMFLLVGGGEGRDRLMKEVADRRLTNIVFVGSQLPRHMPFITNLADVCILPLSSSFLRIAMPKKIFEYAACGKPILCISPYGEASNLLAQWKAGVTVDSNGIDDVIAVMTTLRNRTEALKTMGENARRMAEELFSLKRAGEYLDETLRNVKTIRIVRPHER